MYICMPMSVCMLRCALLDCVLDCGVCCESDVLTVSVRIDRAMIKSEFALRPVKTSFQATGAGLCIIEGEEGRIVVPP